MYLLTHFLSYLLIYLPAYRPTYLPVPYRYLVGSVRDRNPSLSRGTLKAETASERVVETCATNLEKHGVKGVF